jgi:hypothetical protein
MKIGQLDASTMNVSSSLNITNGNLSVCSTSAPPTITLGKNDTSINNEENLGELRWKTNDSHVTTNPENIANISVKADGVLGSSNATTKMIFSTSNGTNGTREFMTINKTGGVLIETSKEIGNENIANLYVNFNGSSNGQRGYYNAPYDTISHALTAAMSGDTIILQTDITENIDLNDTPVTGSTINIVVPEGITWSASMNSTAMIYRSGDNIMKSTLNLHVKGKLYTALDHTLIDCHVAQTNSVDLICNIYGHGSGIIEKNQTNTGSMFVDITLITGMDTIMCKNGIMFMYSYLSKSTLENIRYIYIFDTLEGINGIHVSGTQLVELNMNNIGLIKYGSSSEGGYFIDGGTYITLKMNNVKIISSVDKADIGSIINVNGSSIITNCKIKSLATVYTVNCINFETTDTSQITNCFLIAGGVTVGHAFATGGGPTTLHVANCMANNTVLTTDVNVILGINSGNSLSTSWDFYV